MDIDPRLYSYLVDSLLQKMRYKVSEHIPKDCKVIDIACGTGAQVFQLADKCSSITGIDIWLPMINYAEKKRLNLNLPKLSFKVADARDLSQFKDKEFDYSIMSLALHQFPPEDRILILRETIQISEKMIIADYVVPQPQNIYGLGIRLAERMAGKKHFMNFKNYLYARGLQEITLKIGLRTIHQEIFGKEIFVLGVFKET